jgi:serine protease
VTDDGNLYPVGLLFAGSSTHRLANPIDLVIDRFGVFVDNGETPGPSNYPPVVNFSYQAKGLMVSFTDQSADIDGEVVKWNWYFGEGSGSSTVRNPTYTYQPAGEYFVTLTVTDNDDDSDSITNTVTVTSGDNSDPIISLNATAGKQNKAWRFVDLAWSGASSPNVDIYRDGELIFTTPNDETHTDKISNTGPAIYTYQLCEESTNICSIAFDVQFKKQFL